MNFVLRKHQCAFSNAYRPFSDLARRLNPWQYEMFRLDSKTFFDSLHKSARDVLTRPKTSFVSPQFP